MSLKTMWDESSTLWCSTMQKYKFIWNRKRPQNAADGAPWSKYQRQNKNPWHTTTHINANQGSHFLCPVQRCHCNCGSGSSAGAYWAAKTWQDCPRVTSFSGMVHKWIMLWRFLVGNFKTYADFPHKAGEVRHCVAGLVNWQAVPKSPSQEWKAES